MSSNNNNFHYNKSLQSNANKLRKEATKSEAYLWKFALSKRQMNGYQFRQQRPIGPYIVDFVCLPLKLIIEVDGATHETAEVFKEDRIRETYLKELGFSFIRIQDNDIINDINGVYNFISGWIEKHNSSTPYPPPAWEQIVF